MRADAELFGDIITGRVNAMAALLRGRLVVEGDPSPLVLFQRLFPGPPSPRDRSGDCGATASKDEAARVADGILEAAAFFDGRLPEAFGGYERSLTRYPVQYPTAYSAQAWSTGAPLLFLRTMLGLEPIGEHLVVDPALPSSIGRLELLDIRGRWGRLDAFGRGRVDVKGGTGRRRGRRR